MQSVKVKRSVHTNNNGQPYHRAAGRAAVAADVENPARRLIRGLENNTTADDYSSGRFVICNLEVQRLNIGTK